ncbi:histidine kinase [Paraburkholderia strydomiana]
MSERMRLAELEHANELSTQMQSAREDEQRRIARELHDGLGQQLTALKMGVAALEQQIVPGATIALQRQIDNMLASLRRIAANLRPPMLDDLGLGAALEWLADDFAQRRFGRDAVCVGHDLSHRAGSTNQRGATCVGKRSDHLHGGRRSWLESKHRGQWLRNPRGRSFRTRIPWSVGDAHACASTTWHAHDRQHAWHGLQDRRAYAARCDRAGCDPARLTDAVQVHVTVQVMTKRR